MHPEIQSDFDRLKNQTRLAGNLSSELPSDIQAMVYQLLCVAITGRLEQNLKTIFVCYADRKSSKNMGRAVSRLCQSFQNPKPDKIISLVELFDRDFSKTMSDEWAAAEPSEKDIISNMVGDRIAISHQTTKSINVTKSKIDGYLATYIKVVTKVHNHFLE